MIRVTRSASAIEIALADPARRNAMGQRLFTALEAALAEVAAAERAWEREDGATAPPHAALILRGDGPAFCAGFDLEAIVADPRGPGPLTREFLQRLSGVCRTLRRLPLPVIAAAHGAALAGGCALLSACDFVVVSPTSTLGYPVHRIGVSPAVNTPNLVAMIGPGATRALLLSGDLVDGQRALELGMATHLAEFGSDPAPISPPPEAADVLAVARALAAELARKGPRALRATKRWLNELEGADGDERFDGALAASCALVDGDEAREMLEAFWRRRGPTAARILPS